MTDTTALKPPPRKGIYLLPNLFTLSALFAGFYAIVAGTKGHFDVAAMAIFVAMLLDTMDGRIARLTRTQTEFGAQFDSLSDMVCFGVTPALVLYIWSLATLGKVGWLAAFIYTVGTALRLARFNTQTDSVQNKRYFQGLPTPAAAGVVASMLWVSAKFSVAGDVVAIPVLIIVIALAALKVSTVRYRSFKDFDFRNKVPFISILLIVLVFVLIAVDPADVFLAVFSIYALSGPIETLWLWRKTDKRKKNNRKSKK